MLSIKTIPKPGKWEHVHQSWKTIMSAYTTRRRLDCFFNQSCVSQPLTMQQYARAQAIQDAYRKAEAAHPRENAPKPGEIRSLGLIGKEEESKNVLKSQ
jgi:hypothetical protein